MNRGKVLHLLDMARQASPEVWGGRFAVLALLTLCSLCIWLSWGRLENPMQDQGWYLQVAARVASGQVLYRDVLWMYGPLSVYVLALLFRGLGENVASLFLLYYLLTIVGCLLIYRVARFLLPAAAALLGTVAVFLGGWWGGFIGYTLAYTGAVPLGAVLGLLFLFCLLSYLQSGRDAWLIGAGLATGGALLTKPEFALACLGTGLLVLTATVFSPRGSVPHRGRSMRALGTFGLSTALVAGSGYGLLAYHAGWTPVWTGFTGYDQDLILLREWPPWGTAPSWAYIVSGLGLYLLIVLTLVGVLAPVLVRKHKLRTCLCGALGVAFLVLPWLLRFRTETNLLHSILSSRPLLFQEGIRTMWAPGTVLLTVMFVVLAARWLSTLRKGHQKGPSPQEGYLAVVVVYSALADVRSFLHPAGTFHFHYLDTLFPVLLFVLLALIPQATERWGNANVRRTRGKLVVVGLLVAYGAIGLDWDLAHLSGLDTELSSPRGRALYFSDNDRRRPWPALLQTILSDTDPKDTIAILGNEPGFYFWSQRTNPLRQDAILPGMESGPADAREFVQRLRNHSPALVIIPQGVRTGHGWFWDLDIGRQAYEDLGPVWRYVETNFQLCTFVGTEQWGFAIYEPHCPDQPPIESP